MCAQCLGFARLILLLAWVFGAPAAALTHDTSIEGCLERDYDRYTFEAPAMIPDGDHDGVLLGPLYIPRDGAVLEDVRIRLDIVHSCTGDLDVHLQYDPDRSGRAEATARLEFFRSMPAGCAHQERFFCPAALNGSYFFEDDSDAAASLAAVLAEDAAAFYPNDSLFSVFEGQRRGGAFYLAVADTLALETGTVVGWSVFVKRPDRTHGALEIRALPGVIPEIIWVP